MNDITRHEPSSFLCQRCNRPDAEISGLMISHPEGRWVRYEDYAALLDATTWRPIETAPKDGTEVLATSNYGDGVHHAEVTAFCKGRWVVSNDDDGYAMQFHPSHWMPLPKPPTA